jgi:diaminohydroxyphosphoribosylaminopyrimidine deaminase/5-amino-6-(5-phosphoribosylamino)uracil reductase
MRRALEQARRGLGRTTPNPVVGATIITDEGIVAGDGAHERAGEPHAEIHALKEAGELARGATLYCTLEPCSHTGRTGPCTEAIIAAGIKRVVAAMEDPFPLVSGRGFARLRAHGIDVVEGIGRDESARLNQPFLTAVREQRPFVIVKAAASLDGRIAAAPGVRTQLTSAVANRRVQYLRAQVDAVGVGSETVLVDDPLLTVRDVYRERPLTRVIFDRRRRTPIEARVFSTQGQGPVRLVGSPGDDLKSMLRQLASEGIQSLLLEGGAHLHAAAWDEGLVDYVQLYVAPVALGANGVPLFGGRPWSPASLINPRVEILGPDTLIEGYVHRPH